MSKWFSASCAGSQVFSLVATAVPQQYLACRKARPGKSPVAELQSLELEKEIAPWQHNLVSLWYHWTLPSNQILSTWVLGGIKGPNNSKIHQKQHRKQCCILRVCTKHFGFRCFLPSWCQSCSSPEKTPAGMWWRAGWQLQHWQPQEQQPAAGLLPRAAQAQLLSAGSIRLSVGYKILSSISEKTLAAHFSMKKGFCTLVFVFHSSTMRHPHSWRYLQIQK